VVRASRLGLLRALEGDRDPFTISAIYAGLGVFSALLTLGYERLARASERPPPQRDGSSLCCAHGVAMRRITWIGPCLGLLGLLGCGPSPSEDTGVGREDAALSCRADADCDDTLYCNGAERCAPGEPGASARGCVAGEPPCEAGQRCLAMPRTCVPACDVADDADGDGFVASECGGDDCDDGAPDVHPQPNDLCDAAGVDHDCDPSTPGGLDLDGDRAVDRRCFNVDLLGVETSRGADCNDFALDVAPTASEFCNLRDDDCDGTIDDGVEVTGYADLDGDGAGDPGAPMMACETTGRFVTNDDDCDDTELLVREGRVELCDGVDNDCDGEVDESPVAVPWYVDGDGDGFGDAGAAFVVSCTPRPGRSALATDCDDASPRIHPAAAEQCNGLDDDCNGVADFVSPTGDGEDDDRDGVADASCVGFGRDCDDGSAFVATDAPELCDNGVDDDCDGTVDEDADPVDWYLDVDGDAIGDASSMPVSDCHLVRGRSYLLNDCNDRDPLIRPRTRDGCGLGDEDCDGSVDEDARDRRAVFEDRDGDGVGASSSFVLACGPAPGGYGELPRDCAPDDATRSIVYPDDDDDGDGARGVEPLATCTGSGPFVTSATDCDDTDPDIAGGSCLDDCDGVDDDGDGTIDEDGVMACPNTATTRWACASGRCVLMGCAPGGGDCNARPDDGCEVDTSSDSLRCGSCTTTCDVGEACSMGVCDDPLVDVQAGGASTMVRRRSGAVAFWGLPPNDGSRVAAPATGYGSGIRTPQVSLAIAERALVHRRNRGCAQRADGWYCWGSGDSCAGSVVPFGPTGGGAGIRVPVALPMPDVVDVGLGLCHSCAALASGSVVCWGSGTFAGFSTGPALGDGSGDASTAPVTVLGLADAVEVEADYVYACARRRSGRVICWGDNEAGQLGDGSRLPRSAPLREVEIASSMAPLGGATMLALSGRNVVSAGGNVGTACAVRTDGTVACWGYNASGQLGADSTAADSTRAVPVVAGVGMASPLSSVREVHAGTGHFCALHTDGRVSCWGANGSGQLGNGSTTFARAPVAVTLPAAAARIATGGAHTCALLTDNRLFCWGENDDYQAGSETTADYLVPTEVRSLRRGAP
jgi:hypothetical protein